MHFPTNHTPPIAWRHEFPVDIQDCLVSWENPDGDKAVLGADANLALKAMATGCDNQPVVA